MAPIGPARRAFPADAMTTDSQSSDPIPPAHARAIAATLAVHGLQANGPPITVVDSVLNDNYHVEADHREFFVRVHKQNRTRERLELEHRVIAWAGTHHIPVNPPLADAAGRTVHSSSGLLVAVFPWLDARTLARGSIDAGQAALLGEMQGRIHSAFAAFQPPDLRRGGTGSTWDTEETALVLSRVDDLIRRYPAAGEEMRRLQPELRFQLALLESPEARSTADFDELATQPFHGDYHERNVLLDHRGSIAAVVDWEMAGYLPPIFELLRAVDFCGLLSEPLLRAYLRGYRRSARLDPASISPGVEMWWQSVLHDAWAYRLRFIDGDRRVDRFIVETGARVRRLADPEFRLWLARTVLAALA